tara:strand:- start:333 stop:587 length:255 start_codon:yes stop_codon:yes gene_type:complete
MKWKVSNTLFLVSILIFALGVLFNYMQVKKSVESSLEKARRVKREKAEKAKKEKETKFDEVFEVDEIDEELETIINNNNNGTEK